MMARYSSSSSCSGWRPRHGVQMASSTATEVARTPTRSTVPPDMSPARLATSGLGADEGVEQRHRLPPRHVRVPPPTRSPLDPEEVARPPEQPGDVGGVVAEVVAGILVTLPP